MFSKEKYVDALIRLRDKHKLKSTKYEALLRAQYESKNHTITATKLAEAVGFENYNAANLRYGLLGHDVADLIGFIPPKRKNGEPMWFLAISSGNPASEITIDGHYEFVMREELVQAIESINWFQYKKSLQ